MLLQIDFPPLAVIGLLVLLYLVLGAIFDEVAAMLVTLPFVLPVVTGLGYDPIWWGVVMPVPISLGMMTPPIGMNVFLLNRFVPDIGLLRIYRGVMPFIVADLLRLSLLVLVPSLSLVLLGRLLGTLPPGPKGVWQVLSTIGLGGAPDGRCMTGPAQALGKPYK